MPVLITVKNAHELISKQAGFLGDTAYFFAPGALERKVDSTLAEQLKSALTDKGVVADVVVVPAQPVSVVGADVSTEIPLDAPLLQPVMPPGPADDCADCVAIVVCLSPKPLIAPDHLLPSNLKNGRTPPPAPMLLPSPMPASG